MSKAGKLAKATADIRALVLQEIDVQLSNASVTSETLQDDWEDLVKTNPSIGMIDWVVLVALLEQPILYVLKDPGGPVGAQMRWATVEMGP